MSHACTSTQIITLTLAYPPIFFLIMAILFRCVNKSKVSFLPETILLRGEEFASDLSYALLGVYLCL